jgi:hypothetical protein
LIIHVLINYSDFFFFFWFSQFSVSAPLPYFVSRWYSYILLQTVFFVKLGMIYDCDALDMSFINFLQVYITLLRSLICYQNMRSKYLRQTTLVNEHIIVVRDFFHLTIYKLMENLYALISQEAGNYRS